MRQKTQSLECEQTPSRRGFGLEIPENPSQTLLFECVELSLEVGSGLGLHIVIPEVAVGSRIAVADVAASWECSVVASTSATAIEPLGAVVEGCSEFADNEPLVTAGGETGGFLADHVDVLLRRPCDVVVVKDLVVVVVWMRKNRVSGWSVITEIPSPQRIVSILGKKELTDDDVLGIIVTGSKDTIPLSRADKCIMDHDIGIADSTDLTISIIVETLDGILTSL